MATELTVPTRVDDEPKWGSAHPRRGLNHHDAAAAFLHEFPIGTTLSQEKFGEWAEGHGYVNVPKDVSRSSDEWLAYLQRRHVLRYNINKAGSHPRMADSGLSPFVIETTGQNSLEVRSVSVALAKNNSGNRITSLANTKRRQLGQLMQSADWSLLPAQDRAFAEALYDDIDDFGDDIERRSTRLTNKFAKLERKLRQLNLQLPPPSDNGGDTESAA